MRAAARSTHDLLDETSASGIARVQAIPATLGCSTPRFGKALDEADPASGVAIN